MNRDTPPRSGTHPSTLSESDNTESNQSSRRSHIGELAPKEVGIQYSGREKESVSLELDVDVLGEVETIQREIKQADFGKYEVDLDFEKPLSLQEFVDIIDVRYDSNGYPVAVQINLSNSELVDITVNKKQPSSTTQKGDDWESEDDSSYSIPEPPIVENIDGKSNQRFYDRLIQDENSQPRAMRRIIYEEKELTKGKLESLVESEGYSSTSSGFSTTLRVLEVIGEIEREGIGDEQIVRWTGSEN